MNFEILTVRVYFYHNAFKTGYIFSGIPVKYPEEYRKFRENLLSLTRQWSDNQRGDESCRNVPAWA